MVFAPWYCFSSIDGPATDPRHFPDLACKHREFFFLWWAYLRRYCVQPLGPFANRVYLHDAASPVRVEPMLEELGVSYQVLGPGDYDLDPDREVYLSRQPTELNHFFGSSRATLDYLQCANRHGLDFLLVETDVLIAYDLPADYAGADFYTQKIWDDGSPTIYQGAICFIDRRLVREAFQRGDMARYVTGDRDAQDFHEGEMFRLFCRGRTREMDADRERDGVGRDPARPYVHKTDAARLKRWLAEHPVDCPRVAAYAARL